MVQTTLINLRSVTPQEISVKRSDPVYMAHAYLTKVPITAIEPFIEAFTKPGDLVLDPFAGSGMTGVAAAAMGRRARLFDISALGQHIGSNYTRLVPPTALRAAAQTAIQQVEERFSTAYSTDCLTCGQKASLAKRVWTVLVRCKGCDESVNYYASLEAAAWRKSQMKCPSCMTTVSSKHPRMGEIAAVDYVDCRCSAVQIQQPAAAREPYIDISDLPVPDVTITPDRQMYQASALRKHGLTTIAAFYSRRNFAMLAALRVAIDRESDDALRQKLLFSFTAILTRASKRYQWSHRRPLNAANANYYVAPVFYEWNVIDLFRRKVEAAIRSDAWIVNRRKHFAADPLDVEYEIASADRLPLADSSIDYVFTDPPFGSNLFYADMALFQEAWLAKFTDATSEAVIDRDSKLGRTAGRYENLLSSALAECRRVLKPSGWITMVFGNSTGAVWGIVQRAVQRAGLQIDANTVAILDKGQRSVKGMASGVEHVATVDLILSMSQARHPPGPTRRPDPDEVHATICSLLGTASAESPSHVYLELLRHGLRSNWDLSGLDLRAVTSTAHAQGWAVSSSAGVLMRPPAATIGPRSATRPSVPDSIASGRMVAGQRP